jgi:hypothetical protein
MLGFKNWKKVALDRDEWAKLLKKAVEPMMMMIVNLCARWRRVVNFTPRPLYPQYSLKRRLAGTRRRFGEEKTALLLPEFEFRSFQPIA